MNMRDAVVAEAMTWLRTPWHHMQRVKGSGVDCGQFLISVFASVGLVEPFDVGYYSQDWHLHQEEPRFLNHLLRYASRCWKPERANIAMLQYGRHAAHGAIIVEWPMVIHAHLAESQVSLTDLGRSEMMTRVTGYYQVKGIE